MKNIICLVSRILWQDKTFRFGRMEWSLEERYFPIPENQAIIGNVVELPTRECFHEENKNETWVVEDITNGTIE